MQYKQNIEKMISSSIST